MPGKPEQWNLVGATPSQKRRLDPIFPLIKYIRDARDENILEAIISWHRSFENEKV